MRRGFILFSVLLIAGGVFFILYARSSPVFTADPAITFDGGSPAATATVPSVPAPVPETASAPSEPLSDPPAIARGIYLTGWTAGSSHLDNIIDSLPRTGTNAVVIDVKDYS